MSLTEGSTGATGVGVRILVIVNGATLRLLL